MPVIFELLSPPGSFPRQTMAPILSLLKEIALAPFGEAAQVDAGTSVVRGDDTLCFFPSLPRIRNRRHYEADVNKQAKFNCVQRGTLLIHH